MENSKAVINNILSFTMVNYLLVNSKLGFSMIDFFFKSFQRVNIDTLNLESIV